MPSLASSQVATFRSLVAKDTPLVRYLWLSSLRRRNGPTGKPWFTSRAFLYAADYILYGQAATRKRLACESQKPGWNDLQGGACRLLGVIIYYRTNTNEVIRVLERDRNLCVRE